MRFLFFASMLFLIACGESNRSDKVVVKPIQTIEKENVKIDILEFDEFEKYLKTPASNLRVLHLWAAWCAPCLHELPNWEQAVQEYAGKPIEWVFVDLSYEDQLETKTVELLQKYPHLRPVVHLNPALSTEWAERLHPDWQSSLPSTLLLMGEQTLLLEKTLSIEEIRYQLGNFVR